MFKSDYKVIDIYRSRRGKFKKFDISFEFE